MILGMLYVCISQGLNRHQGSMKFCINPSPLCMRPKVLLNSGSIDIDMREHLNMNIQNT